MCFWAVTHRTELESRSPLLAQPLLARTPGWGKVSWASVSHRKLSCCNREAPRFSRPLFLSSVREKKPECSQCARLKVVLTTFTHFPALSHVQGRLGSVTRPDSHAPGSLPTEAAPLSLFTVSQPLTFSQSMEPALPTSGPCRCCSLCPKCFASSWHGSLFSVTLTDRPTCSACSPVSPACLSSSWSDY